MLYLGTMFAPVKDRGGAGKGFTHKIGDVVSISTPALGTLTNPCGCAPMPALDLSRQPPAARPRPPGRPAVSRHGRPPPNASSRNPEDPMTEQQEPDRRRVGRRVRGRQHQPVQHQRGGRRLRPRQRRRHADAPSPPPRRPSRPGRARRRCERHEVLSKAAARDPRPQGRARRRCCRREEGKTLAEGIGETTRAAQIFDVLRRRRPAAHRRDAALGPARRRRRDHPRGDGRRSASSRRGTSRSPSRPGRSRRRSPTATPW